MHTSHLTAATRAGKVANALAFYFLCLSNDSGARAVVIDQAAAAELLGVCGRTIGRALERLTDARIFLEVSAGRYRAGPAWPELAIGEQWHPIRPGLLRSLLRLNRHSDGGNAAFRLALYLIVPLRAAAHRGRQTLDVPSRRACDKLGISPATFRRACQLLELDGLIRWRRAPGYPRHAPTFGHLAAGLAVTDEPARRWLAPKPRPMTERAPPPDKPDTPLNTPATTTHAPTHTRTRDPSPMTATRQLVWELLGGRDGHADRIARLAGTPERLRRWLAQEAPELAGKTNPFGRLYWLATGFVQSRPDAPSSLHWRPDPDRPGILIAKVEPATVAELAEAEAATTERRAMAAAAEADAAAARATRRGAEAAKLAEAAELAETVADCDRLAAAADQAAAEADAAAELAADTPDADDEPRAADRARVARTHALHAAGLAAANLEVYAPRIAATRARLADVESARQTAATVAADQAARAAFRQMLRRSRR